MFVPVGPHLVLRTEGMRLRAIGEWQYVLYVQIVHMYVPVGPQLVLRTRGIRYLYLERYPYSKINTYIKGNIDR